MTMPDRSTFPGLISPAELAAIYRRADKCDDDERKRRGKLPRATRCRQCATILTLLSHIEELAALTARAGEPATRTEEPNS